MYFYNSIFYIPLCLFIKSYNYIFQRVERELQIKGAGHLFSGPRNSIINQSQQQQQQDPSETEALLPGMLNIDLPAQSTSPHGIFFTLLQRNMHLR